MSDLAILKQLPCKKADIEIFVSQAVEKFLSSELSPLAYAPYLKAMEDIIKGIRDNKDVKELMIYELEQAGGKMDGISIVETSRYDYSNDLVWVQLSEKEKQLLEQRKLREEMLKQITVGGFEDMANPGVIFEAPKKNITKTIRVTLK